MFCCIWIAPFVVGAKSSKARGSFFCLRANQTSGQSSNWYSTQFNSIKLFNQSAQTYVVQYEPSFISVFFIKLMNSLQRLFTLWWTQQKSWLEIEWGKSGEAAIIYLPIWQYCTGESKSHWPHVNERMFFFSLQKMFQMSPHFLSAIWNFSQIKATVRNRF